MKKGLYLLIIVILLLVVTACDKEYQNDTIVCNKESSSKYATTEQKFEIVVTDGVITSTKVTMNIVYFDKYVDQFNADILKEELNDNLEKYGDIQTSVNDRGARVVVTFTNENLENYFGTTIDENGNVSKFINRVIRLLEDDQFKC